MEDIFGSYNCILLYAVFAYGGRDYYNYNRRA